MKRNFVLIVLALLAAATLTGLAVRAQMRPLRQEALIHPRIYAYRDWQSVGVQLHVGDEVRIEAAGEWLYTPGEYHGPEGHARYLAPAFYPLPHVRGGALIGRIGEDGAPFYVGKRAVWRAERDGLLYLRIDDDILSDNEGYVTVKVAVAPAFDQLP